LGLLAFPFAVLGLFWPVLAIHGGAGGLVLLLWWAAVGTGIYIVVKWRKRRKADGHTRPLRQQQVPGSRRTVTPGFEAAHGLPPPPAAGHLIPDRQQRGEDQVEQDLARLRSGPAPAPGPTEQGGTSGRAAFTHDLRGRANRDERPPWMVEGALHCFHSQGNQDVEVVGESFYQDNLWKVVGGRPPSGERVRQEIFAILVAEVGNPHDANAIAVWIDGGSKAGHLSREIARLYRPGLLALQEKQNMPVAVSGVIVGGGMREDGPGRLGVFLQLDPADFGIS
jgi:hypothetical protein